MTIVVKTLTKRGTACPTQWSGKGVDGEDIYIRYHWGYLSVDVDGRQVYGQTHGDSLDGVLSNAAMRRYLSGVLSFALMD